MCLITTTYYPFDVSPETMKKRKFTVQKIGTSFFAVHRKTWCRFRHKKASKKKFTINVERTAKKWKSEKCYVLENQSVANSCTKKKLKMLLQRSLKGKKLKLNKNGKTTVITSTVKLHFAYDLFINCRVPYYPVQLSFILAMLARWHAIHHFLLG